MAAALGVTVAAVGSGTSVTTATRTSAAAGSVFNVFCISDATPNTPTDSKGNTYSAVTTLQTMSSINSRLYEVINGTGGASHTWSFGTPFSADLSIIADEKTGCLTAAARDQQTQGTDATSPYGDALSITTTQADEIISEYISGNSATNPATHTAGASFTLQESITTGGPNWTGASAHRVVAATGTYSGNFTENGASNSAVHIVSYKASGGGGGGVTVKALAALGVG